MSCACDPSVHLSVPSICFVHVFKSMSEAISLFRSLELDHRCLLSLCYSLGDCAYYVVGQEPAIAVHIALRYVVLVCHQYDVCKNYFGSLYVGGYGGLSESGLCVFRELCPVSFLVVGKGPSVLL